MSRSVELLIKPTIFDKEKPLIIKPEFIEFDNKNLSKFEINELRYGVKAIQGYRFRIGRIYCIDIKNFTGTIIKIRLKSIYRINKKKLGQKYKMILDALFENFFNDISTGFMKNFKDGIEFDLSGIKFTKEGILIDKKSDIILWRDLGTKNYSTYYSLFSKSNPNRYKALNYLTDWNTSVLYSVSRTILKQKHLIQNN
jgi:hypothetical protein